MNPYEAYKKALDQHRPPPLSDEEMAWARKNAPMLAVFGSPKFRALMDSAAFTRECDLLYGRGRSAE